MHISLRNYPQDVTEGQSRPKTRYRSTLGPLQQQQQTQRLEEDAHDEYEYREKNTQALICIYSDVSNRTERRV